MLRKCILAAEDCESYLNINKFYQQFNHISHNKLVLKHHMKMPHFCDPLPMLLLQLFIKDNNIEIDSNDFELIWSDTEFSYINNEWIWQKNLIVEFYWRKEHFKLEFYLNLQLRKNDRWLILKCEDYSRVYDFFSDKIKNIQIVNKDYKQPDLRSSRILNELTSWSNLEEMDFYMSEDSIKDLLKISEHYQQSPDSYIDVTDSNKKGYLSYQDFNIQSDISLSEILEEYKFNEYDVSNRHLQIIGVAENLRRAYEEGIYFLLDLKKVIMLKE